MHGLLKMIRRPVDSDYIRKRRYSRRAKDNWRRIKAQTQPYKYGHRNMLRDEPLIVTAGILVLAWFTFTLWWVWSVF